MVTLVFLCFSFLPAVLLLLYILLTSWKTFWKILTYIWPDFWKWMTIITIVSDFLMKRFVLLKKKFSLYREIKKKISKNFGRKRLTLFFNAIIQIWFICIFFFLHNLLIITFETCEHSITENRTSQTYYVKLSLAILFHRGKLFCMLFSFSVCLNNKRNPVHP